MTSALLERLHTVFAQDDLGQCAQDLTGQDSCPAVEGRRQAAVLLALTDEQSPRLLLIRRSLHLPTHPGEIAFPGGKCDPDDTDLYATALREAWEEVALPGESVSCAGMLTPRISVTDLHVTPVVGVIPPDLTLRAHAGEVAEILYVPLTYFVEVGNLRADRIFVEGNERIAARFQFEHYTVWGLTARFIVELVNRLYNAGLNVELRAQHVLGES